MWRRTFLPLHDVADLEDCGTGSGQANRADDDELCLGDPNARTSDKVSTDAATDSGGAVQSFDPPKMTTTSSSWVQSVAAPPPRKLFRSDQVTHSLVHRCPDTLDVVHGTFSRS